MTCSAFIADEPKIEVERRIVYSGAGIESKMTCIVSAYPEAIIIWYKDNKKLTHNKELKMEHRTINGNKTKHTLKIMHTSARDFGEYQCRAENIMGENTKSITLTGTIAVTKNNNIHKNKLYNLEI